MQGSNPLHQLETIIAKMGVPPKEQLSFVTHPAARKVSSKHSGKQAGSVSWSGRQQGT